MAGIALVNLLSGPGHMGTLLNGETDSTARCQGVQ